MKKYIFFLLLIFQCIYSQNYFQKISSGPLVQDDGYCINAAWGDFDNDGYQDIVTAQCYSSCTTCVYPIYLYHNNNGYFSRVTNNAIAQTPCPGIVGLCWGDYDNDNKLDLFLGCRYGNNVLFHNEGNGNFNQITTGILVNELTNSRSCSWVDYDRDGWLDVFVANFNHRKNFLYHNNGNGTFTKITSGSIVNDAVNSAGSTWGDYDNDGWPDLFVATENNENDLLYHNNGNGTFTKITTGPVVNDGISSCQCAWGDYDNDGFLDLIVTNYYTYSNRLYHNDHNGNFSLSNIMPSVAYGQMYGACWGDYNNDGYIDLHIATTSHSCYLLKNNSGINFANMTNEIAANEVGQDGTWADVDNNGKLDLLVNYVPTKKFYLNIGPTGNYLICKLKGCQSNRAAIGARVIVKSGNLRLTREVCSGDGNENMLWQHFGLGTNTMVDSVIVLWPFGSTERKQVIRNITVNSTILIDECNIGIKPVSTEIPTEYKLYQNYPNPFNPLTKIKFDIGPPLIPLLLKEGTLRSAGVVLTIYDILGKEIAVLVNEHLSPGTYEVEWNASSVPSGVYFYRLVGEGFSETKRMVLLK